MREATKHLKCTFYQWEIANEFRSDLLTAEKSRTFISSSRNRTQDPIFAKSSLIGEILKSKESHELDVSNLWEDYGLSKNDNRFKDLKIASCGLITKEKCKEFKNKVEKSSETRIGKTYQEIGDNILIETISILLAGLGSELFKFDLQQRAFYINKLPICLTNFTRKRSSISI